MVHIYIGAGHGKSASGGYDPGAVSGSYVEEKIAEKIVVAAAKATARQGFLVHYDTSAEKRNYVEAAQYANAIDADYAVEVHLNVTASHGASGTLALVYGSASDATKAKARLLVIEVARALGHPDQGVIARDREYFNRATKMPSCILEVAYLDNKADQADISQPGFSNNVGEAMARAFCTMYGKTYKPAKVLPPPPPPPLTVYAEGVKDIGSVRVALLFTKGTLVTTPEAALGAYRNGDRVVLVGGPAVTKWTAAGGRVGIPRVVSLVGSNGLATLRLVVSKLPSL